MDLLVLLIVVLLLVGAAPAYPYSRGWGYGPFGMIFAVLIVLVLMRVL